MTGEPRLPGFAPEPELVCPGCRSVGYQAGHPGCPAEARLSGRTDPETSRTAARRMISSGALGRAARVALEAVRRWPGRTAPQLGELMAAEDPEGRSAEWWRQAIGRRLGELEQAGEVTRGQAVHSCTTWAPAENNGSTTR